MQKENLRSSVMIDNYHRDHPPTDRVLSGSTQRINEWLISGADSNTFSLQHDSSSMTAADLERWKEDELSQYKELTGMKNLIKEHFIELTSSIYDLLAWKDIVVNAIIQRKDSSRDGGQQEMPWSRNELMITDLLLLCSKLYRRDMVLAELLSAFFKLVFSNFDGLQMGDVPQSRQGEKSSSPSRSSSEQWTPGTALRSTTNDMSCIIQSSKKSLLKKVRISDEIIEIDDSAYFEEILPPQTTGQTQQINTATTATINQYNSHNDNRNDVVDQLKNQSVTKPISSSPLRDTSKTNIEHTVNVRKASQENSMSKISQSYSSKSKDGYLQHRPQGKKEQVFKHHQPTSSNGYNTDFIAFHMMMKRVATEKDKCLELESIVKRQRVEIERLENELSDRERMLAQVKQENAFLGKRDQVLENNIGKMYDELADKLSQKEQQSYQATKLVKESNNTLLKDGKIKFNDSADWLKKKLEGLQQSFKMILDKAVLQHIAPENQKNLTIMAMHLEHVTSKFDSIQQNMEHLARDLNQALEDKMLRSKKEFERWNTWKDENRKMLKAKQATVLIKLHIDHLKQAVDTLNDEDELLHLDIEHAKCLREGIESPFDPSKSRSWNLKHILRDRILEIMGHVVKLQKYTSLEGETSKDTPSSLHEPKSHLKNLKHRAKADPSNNSNVSSRRQHNEINDVIVERQTAITRKSQTVIDNVLERPQIEQISPTKLNATTNEQQILNSLSSPSTSIEIPRTVRTQDEISGWSSIPASPGPQEHKNGRRKTRSESLSIDDILLSTQSILDLDEENEEDTVVVISPKERLPKNSEESSGFQQGHEGVSASIEQKTLVSKELNTLRKQFNSKLRFMKEVYEHRIKELETKLADVVLQHNAKRNESEAGASSIKTLPEKGGTGTTGIKSRDGNDVLGQKNIPLTDSLQSGSRSGRDSQAVTSKRDFHVNETSSLKKYAGHSFLVEDCASDIDDDSLSKVAACRSPVDKPFHQARTESWERRRAMIVEEQRKKLEVTLYHLNLLDHQHLLTKAGFSQHREPKAHKWIDDDFKGRQQYEENEHQFLRESLKVRAWEAAKKRAESMLQSAITRTHFREHESGSANVKLPEIRKRFDIMPEDQSVSWSRQASGDRNRLPYSVPTVVPIVNGGPTTRE